MKGKEKEREKEVNEGIIVTGEEFCKKWIKDVGELLSKLRCELSEFRLNIEKLERVVRELEEGLSGDSDEGSA